MHLKENHIICEFLRIGKMGCWMPYYYTTGYAYLARQPKPGTIKCTFNGQPLEYDDFDPYERTLYFSIDKAFYFDRVREEAGDDKDNLLVKIEYVESPPLEIKTEDVDTVEGIKKALDDDLAGLYKLIKERMWLAKYGNNGEFMSLHEFILFGGRIKLTSRGDVHYIIIDDKNTAEGRVLTLPGCEDVMMWADFSGNLKHIGAYWGETGQAIPSEKDRCPLCGRNFTLKDIRHGTIECNSYMNAPLHGYFHSDCWAAYEEILRIQRQKR
jgi:hypothetical protein